MKTNLKQLVYQIFENFCSENNLDINLSFAMPKGYENAYGTFDNNTLFLNFDLLQDKTTLVFNLFHELRHAFQYKHPEKFDLFFQKSLKYVVLYDGTCFKLFDKEWKICHIKDSKENLLNVYANLPYELDANQFAFENTKNLLGDSKQLQKIFLATQPKKKLKIEEIDLIFALIDANFA